MEREREMQKLSDSFSNSAGNLSLIQRDLESLEKLGFP
jgi:hypothetical protein